MNQKQAFYHWDLLVYILSIDKSRTLGHLTIAFSTWVAVALLYNVMHLLGSGHSTYQQQLVETFSSCCWRIKMAKTERCLKKNSLLQVLNFFPFLAILFEMGLCVCILAAAVASAWNVSISATRFGEISPFWLKFLIVFDNFSKAIFSIRQHFDPNLAKKCYWAKFHCCNWPNIEK